MKRFWRVFLSRTFFIGLLAVIQIGVFSAVVFELNRINTVVYTIITILAFLTAFVVFERDNLNPAYKMMWILLIAIMPVSGVLYYLFFGKRYIAPKKAKILNRIEQREDELPVSDTVPMQELAQESPNLMRCAQYLSSVAKSPLYRNTATEYYAMGQDFFVRFLEELRRAQKYIFLEYFIIDDDSRMWRETLAILREKAAAGVDVRILYDSLGCLATLPADYDLALRSEGIRCFAFNELHLSLHISDYKLMNHRDHRKIAVIDGEVGFSGGLNFADEYINERKRFGVWKDTGFCLRGPAVYSLTVMFLKMWDFVTDSESHFDGYIPQTSFPGGGFVQPYGDSPLDGENVAESTYFNVLHSAQKYVYIMTPYLVVDNEMLTSLCLAAKNGVDVRILTPAIPDKWYVSLVTKSYYKRLLEAGVRIYEYTPGFVHAKMYVSDDQVAIVGSANMDYRSLYLHFENCCVFYHGSIVQPVRQDFDSTLAESHEMTLEEVKQTPIYMRLAQILLGIFAPMM